MCGLGEMGIHRGLKGGGWIRYSALVWNTAVEITLWGVCGVGEDLMTFGLWKGKQILKVLGFLMVSNIERQGNGLDPFSYHF